MDGVVESRAKDNEIEVEFFEETPKELQGDTFLHHNQIKVMFWNCHGAGNKDFISVCKKYIRENYPYVFMIMETRIDPSLLSKTFSFLGFEGYLFVENQGAWGIAWAGIMIFCGSLSCKSPSCFCTLVLRVGMKLHGISQLFTIVLGLNGRRFSGKSS